MRRRAFALISTIAFIAACARKDRAPSAPLSDDVKRDLELVSSPSPGLSSSTAIGPHTAIVSAIERSSARAPTTRHAAPKSLAAAPQPIDNAGAASPSNAVAAAAAPVAAPAAATSAPVPDPNAVDARDSSAAAATAGPRPKPPVPDSSGVDLPPFAGKRGHGGRGHRGHLERMASAGRA